MFLHFGSKLKHENIGLINSTFWKKTSSSRKCKIQGKRHNGKTREWNWGSGHIYRLPRLPHSLLPWEEILPVWPGYQAYSKWYFKTFKNNKLSAISKKMWSKSPENPIENCIKQKSWPGLGIGNVRWYYFHYYVVYLILLPVVGNISVVSLAVTNRSWPILIDFAPLSLWPILILYQRTKKGATGPKNR